MALIESHTINAVTTVTLNRPDSRNALNVEMMEGLTALFEKLQEDDNTRMVVLTGQGKCFCAGADIEEMKAKTDPKVLEKMFAVVGDFSKPLVGVVHGAAIGGGLGLTACCDVVLARKGCTFALSEVRLGILPAVIMPYVHRKIGFSHMSRYMLSGERFESDKALELSLVHEVFESADELQKLLDTLCENILQGAPSALSLSKQLLREVDEAAFEELRVLTAETIAEQRQHPEAQEGLKAFFEKRPPGWVKK